MRVCVLFHCDTILTHNLHKNSTRPYNNSYKRYHNSCCCHIWQQVILVCFYYFLWPIFLLSMHNFSGFWHFQCVTTCHKIVSREHLLGRKLGSFRSRRKSLGCSGLCGVWVTWFVRSPPPGGHMGLADPCIHCCESVCFLHFWLHFVFIGCIHFSYIAYSENAAKTVRHLQSKTTPCPACCIWSTNIKDFD